MLGDRSEERGYKLYKTLCRLDVGSYETDYWRVYRIFLQKEKDIERKAER